MASRVSCFRETARQGRPRLVRAFIYLSIYLGHAALGACADRRADGKHMRVPGLSSGWM